MSQPDDDAYAALDGEMSVYASGAAAKAPLLDWWLPSTFDTRSTSAQPLSLPCATCITASSSPVSGRSR
jgi:hypothetical protein